MLLVIVAVTLGFVNWFLEALIQFERVRPTRLTYLKDYWIRCAAQAIIRSAFMASS